MKTPDAVRLASRFILATVVTGLLNSTILAGELLCAVGYNGEFTYIDLTTGEVTLTRNDLPEGLQALARAPDGTLFAGRAGELYTLDPLTGDTSLFLSLDLDIHGMAFSPSGDLYVIESAPREPDTLTIVNLKDGTFRSVNDLWGDVRDAEGLAFSPDGELYGVLPRSSAEGTYDLFTIDLDDAKTDLIGSQIGVDLSQSLIFTPSGRLYALGKTNGPDGAISSFARLDPSSGDIMGPVLTFPGDYRGLELVPEPATLLLLGLGGVVLLSRPRRNCRA